MLGGELKIDGEIFTLEKQQKNLFKEIEKFNPEFTNFYVLSRPYAEGRAITSCRAILNLDMVNFVFKNRVGETAEVVLEKKYIVDYGGSGGHW